MASLPARVCKTFLAQPVCSGLAGRGRLGLGEADSVLCPRQGGGQPGTSVSEVAAKLAREGCRLSRRYSPGEGGVELSASRGGAPTP